MGRGPRGARGWSPAGVGPARCSRCHVPGSERGEAESERDSSPFCFEARSGCSPQLVEWRPNLQLFRPCSAEVGARRPQPLPPEAAALAAAGRPGESPRRPSLRRGVSVSVAAAVCVRARPRGLGAGCRLDSLHPPSVPGEPAGRRAWEQRRESIAVADLDTPRRGGSVGSLNYYSVAAASSGLGNRSAGGAGLRLTGSDQRGSRRRVARAAAGWAPSGSAFSGRRAGDLSRTPVLAEGGQGAVARSAVEVWAPEGRAGEPGASWRGCPRDRASPI